MIINDFEWQRGEKIVQGIHESHPEMKDVPTMSRRLCSDIKRLETAPLRIKEREQLERGLEIFITDTREKLRSVRVREGDSTGHHRQNAMSLFKGQEYAHGAKLRDSYERCPACGCSCNIRRNDGICYHCTLVLFSP